MKRKILFLIFGLTFLFLPSKSIHLKAVEESSIPLIGTIKEGTYIINDNITLEGNLYVKPSENEGVLIYLNGGSINLNGYQIYNKGNLSIVGKKDCLKSITYKGEQINYSGGLIFNGNGTNGGCIYNDDVLSLEDIYIYGCKAKNLGGGIYNADKTVLYNVTIDSCSASYGGGIYNNDDLSILEAENDSDSCSNIINNIAYRSGGGIYTNNKAIFKNALNIENNIAYENGGGIYNDNLLFVSNDYLQIEDELNNHVFNLKNNQANKAGGAIYSCGKCSLENTSILGNEAKSFGGGIYNDNEMELDSFCVVNDNIAFIDGGGIYNSGNLNMIYHGYYDYEMLKIKNNEAENGDGGGIYNSSSASLSMVNSKIVANEANYNGGGIYNDGYCSFKSKKVIIGENTIYYQSSIENNFSNNGGGIYNSGTFDFDGKSINYNGSSVNGGGIYNLGSFALLGNSLLDETQNVSISRNTCEESGGGIYNLGLFKCDSYLLLEISYNNALIGGAVVNNNNNNMAFELFGKEINIKNNYARNKAGGIYHAYGSLDIKGEIVNIVDNYCQNGGNEYLNSDILLAENMIINSIDVDNGSIGIFTENKPSSDNSICLTLSLNGNVNLKSNDNSYYVNQNYLSINVSSNPSSNISSSKWLILLEVVLLILLCGTTVMFRNKNLNN